MEGVKLMGMPPEKSWLLRLLTIFTALSISVSSWFLNQTMGNLNELNSRVSLIEINDARTDATKFTSREWNAAKVLIDTVQIQNERRITTLEQNNLAIKELLVEIKASIKELK